MPKAKKAPTVSDEERAAHLLLFHECTGLAIGMAKNAAKRLTSRPFDDYVQAALMGAWEAVLTFDESKGPIRPWATKRIKGRIRDCCYRLDIWGFAACKAAWRERNSTPSVVSLNPLDELMHKGEDPDYSLDDLDVAEVVIGSIYNPDAKEVARLYYLKGMPHPMIAKELGVSVTRVEQWSREANDDIRGKLLALRRSWAGLPYHQMFDGEGFFSSREVPYRYNELPVVRHLRRLRNAEHNMDRLRAAVRRFGMVVVRNPTVNEEFILGRGENVIAVWNPFDATLEWDGTRRKVHDWGQLAWFCQHFIARSYADEGNMPVGDPCGSLDASAC